MYFFFFPPGRRETKSSSFQQQGNRELSFGIPFHPQFRSSVFVSVTGSVLSAILIFSSISQVYFRICIEGKTCYLLDLTGGLLIVFHKHSLNIGSVRSQVDLLVKSSLVLPMFFVQSQKSGIFQSSIPVIWVTCCASRQVIYCLSALIFLPHICFRHRFHVGLDTRMECGSLRGIGLCCLFLFYFKLNSMPTLSSTLPIVTLSVFNSSGQKHLPTKTE